MAKETKRGFGYIDSIEKTDGSSYTISDFRRAFLRIPGLYKLYVAESSHPNRYFIYFYLYEEGECQRYIYSSCGCISDTDNGFTLTADDGLWNFVISDDGLDDLSKAELLLNTMTSPYNKDIDGSIGQDSIL